MALVACQGDCDDDGFTPLPDSRVPPDQFVRCPRTKSLPCNPLFQSVCAADEKCTWMVDSLQPYIGLIDCAPVGDSDVGQPCRYGPPGCDGYDNCKKGLVCGDFRGGEGICKQICDQQGGTPTCDDQHACVTYSGLFDFGDAVPKAAGVCDLACDPLSENDFDGAGSDWSKTTTLCGSNADVGCYGYPSSGTPPKTAWSCSKDTHAAVAQPIGLRHRVQCTESNGCADPGPTIYMNSCNQGYVPLLRESTTMSATICVALCKPKNCFAGNCGPSDENRLGEAPHRCTNPDRVGSFDTSAGGEHCRFIWSFERDDQGNFLRSASSDTVGFCFDHSKYLYDSNADNTPDTPYPPCASLPDGFGTTSPVDGAADLGCVDTAHAQLAHGKALPRPFDELRPLTHRDVTSQ